ncbi:hypothetical protein [Methylobacterium tarhaniae]|uniref:hypothetical protein n=1 Tax=Methylobacterium tarhaniae TaxID=1187852 RepID=UPI003CFFCE47
MGEANDEARSFPFKEKLELVEEAYEIWGEAAAKSLADEIGIEWAKPLDPLPTVNPTP